MPKPNAIIGVSDHGGWAVLVAATRDGAVLDRRRIELIAPGLPSFPHHHEAQWAQGRYLDVPWARKVSLEEAFELIKRAQASAIECATASLDTVATEVDAKITGLAIRACPELPPTVAERVADQRAQTMADSVMYREALAGAAKARGWAVHWYDKKTVFDAAARALGLEKIDPLLAKLGKSLGPPWQADHKLATAAAIAAPAAKKR
jgi:hypothetical protein